MLRLISFPFSVLVLLLVLATLAFFHPVQWICFNVFGYQAHKKSVDCLNWVLLRIINLLGTRFTFSNRELIPEGVPLIIVCNHQGLYDIIAIIWFLRKFHPKFVSKKELGKGIPSVSYNLKHGGSVLIDRKAPKQAIPKIKSLAEYIEKHKRSAVIFPEGTRSRNGKPRKFTESGLKILCKYSPSAFVVPITINNSWKLLRYGLFPYGLCSNITFTVHKPMPVKDTNIETLIETTEKVIVEGIK